MKVIGCSGGAHIARSLSQELKISLVLVETRFFPDGEVYVRIPETVGKEAIIVQSMAKRPNDLLMEFLLTLEALSSMGVKRLVGVIPYFPYARQDSRFKPGEALSVEVISRLLEQLNLDLVLTVDVHLHRRKLEEIFKGLKVVNISAMEKLAEYFLKKYTLDDAIVVAPDVEAEQWASIFAKKLGLRYVVFTKERKGDEDVIIKEEIYEREKVETAIVVDDIVSTGSTLEAIANILLDKANNLYAAFTHAILVPPAEHRLSLYKDIVSTDTIVNPYSKIKVGPLIAKTLVKYI